jgi:hypothetical protein
MERFWAKAMKALDDEQQSERDACTWYKHEGSNQWFPVPQHFTVPYAATGDDDDVFS